MEADATERRQRQEAQERAARQREREEMRQHRALEEARLAAAGGGQAELMGQMVAPLMVDSTAGDRADEQLREMGAHANAFNRTSAPQRRGGFFGRG